MTERGFLLVLLLAISISAFAALKLEKIGAFSGDATGRWPTFVPITIMFLVPHVSARLFAR